jgi:putative membrane protein
VPATERKTIEQAEYFGETQIVRGIVGGTLMGLANLVPGISGGTMLLATGVYPQFIGGIAELTTLKFRAKTMLQLASIVGAALAAIVLLAGPVSALVVEKRWVMYSVFIGLTLGGVPIIWRMAKPVDAVVIVMATIGIAVMVAMALVKPGGGAAGADGSHEYVALFLAGLAGASAMVLPGVSGGYLLLVLGQYVAILSAIDLLKDSAQAGNWSAAAESLHVIIPVGLGVLIGVVGVSNLIKILLAKYERATLGVLLGLLLGAVVGIWPFQEGVAPDVGSVFRGDVVAEVDGELVMQTTGRVIEAKDYDTAFFAPSGLQIGGAIGLVLVGLGASLGVAMLGNSGKAAKPQSRKADKLTS